jgi:hypothetical protein
MFEKYGEKDSSDREIVRWLISLLPNEKIKRNKIR